MRRSWGGELANEPNGNGQISTVVEKQNRKVLPAKLAAKTLSETIVMCEEGEERVMGCVDGERAGEGSQMLAHLAPSLVHLIAQGDDLVELADVGRDGEHILLPDNLRELIASRLQTGLVDVRDRDLESNPTAAAPISATDDTRGTAVRTLRARWRRPARCRSRRR